MSFLCPERFLMKSKFLNSYHERLTHYFSWICSIHQVLLTAFNIQSTALHLGWCQGTQWQFSICRVLQNPHIYFLDILLKTWEVAILYINSFKEKKMSSVSPPVSVYKKVSDIELKLRSSNFGTHHLPIASYSLP